MTRRCHWTGEDELMIRYHDEEWGIPVHDDLKLFEFFVLDAFQAGLSWKTVLHKREAFRVAFDGFDPQEVAKFTEKRVAALMNNPGIIRNRLKIAGTITNARLFLEIQKEFGSFDRYIWQFTGFKIIRNKHRIPDTIPVSSPQSDTMSMDLRKRGFKFVGTTICYAFMQATGMVNDHLTGCFRYEQCGK